MHCKKQKQQIKPYVFFYLFFWFTIRCVFMLCVQPNYFHKIVVVTLLQLWSILYFMPVLALKVKLVCYGSPTCCSASCTFALLPVILCRCTWCYFIAGIIGLIRLWVSCYIPSTVGWFKGKTSESKECWNNSDGGSLFFLHIIILTACYVSC